jgi:two-component system C4-dicarboxylate transport sensor histidine kinase DctB
MMSGALSRAMLIAAYLVCVLAVSAGVWRYGYLAALDQLAQQGRADLALASDRLTGQLQRYREVAVLLADHPAIDELAQERGAEAATDLFVEVADKTGALDLMFVDKAGIVRAAARALPGADLSDTGFVARAGHGALGWGHSVGHPLPQRAFYYASPTFGPDGKVQGSVVVAADINAIEDDWRGGNRVVFFTDADGVVYVSNRSELVFWQRDPQGPGLKPPLGEAPPFESYFTGPHEVWELGWGRYLPQNALHLVQDLPVIGLKGEVLMDVTPARRLARLQAAAIAALCLAFGALLFLATERRRTLAVANAQLEERVANRTRALSQMNADLRQEAAEREEAQTALARAQGELLQASKMSALGQMSAGISHELNQPLMAIRSFSENAVQFVERGNPDRAVENLGRISDMARRMGRIIKNLRAFSKQEMEPPARIDLVAVLDVAVDMVADRADRMGAAIVYNRPPNPIWVHGGEVRLGQVFVNLMTNALDAVQEAPLKTVEVEVSEGSNVTVTVADSGPGVDAPEKVFDPFYSTKEVGASEGMGLGLSISFGIIQSFGGAIRVTNSEKGAVFTIELQRWQEQNAA